MRRLTERLLELAGFKIWPPTHNDPSIKGPQPRILTKRQWEVMEKMRQENPCEREQSEERKDNETVA